MREVDNGTIKFGILFYGIVGLFAIFTGFVFLFMPEEIKIIWTLSDNTWKFAGYFLLVGGVTFLVGMGSMIKLARSSS